MFRWESCRALCAVSLRCSLIRASSCRYLLTLHPISCFLSDSEVSDWTVPAQAALNCRDLTAPEAAAWQRWSNIWGEGGRGPPYASGSTPGTNHIHYKDGRLWANELSGWIWSIPAMFKIPVMLSGRWGRELRGADVLDQEADLSLFPLVFLKHRSEQDVREELAWINRALGSFTSSTLVKFYWFWMLRFSTCFSKCLTWTVF